MTYFGFCFFFFVVLVVVVFGFFFVVVVSALLAVGFFLAALPDPQSTVPLLPSHATDPQPQ